MSRNQRLQLHQFEINQKNIINRELFVYSWPEKLINLVLGSKDDMKLNYAVRNLSGIIALSVDNVVYTRNNIRREQKRSADKYWIFSLKEISSETVTSLKIGRASCREIV